MILTKQNNGIFLIGTGFPEITAGIAARDALSIDYASDKSAIRAGERALLADITGAEKKNILFLDQVHRDGIVTVEEYPSEETHVFASADGFVTRLKNLCIVIRTADCVPILFYDEKNKVIAAVHAGWKGCSLGIASKAANMMMSGYSSRPEDIFAWILPSIGPESYEVHDDVTQFFPAHTRRREKKLFVDLPSSSADSILSAGIPLKNIFKTDICTMKQNADFFSHRKGDTGRNLNFICIV